MNCFERIDGTLQGNPLDRRAFIPVLSLYGARLTDCPLDQYYSDPEAYTAGQVAVNNEFKPDVLFGPFAFALVGAAFGSQIKKSRSNPPNISKPAVSSLKEWDRLALPDLDTNPHLLYLRKSIRLMATEFEGRVPVAACLPAPIDIPALVLGMEGWMELLLFDPKNAERVLERVNQFFVMLTNTLFAEGAMIAFLPCGYASPAVLMRDTVEHLLRPALDKALSEISGPAVLHHCGATFLAHLDILKGLPAAVGYALSYEEGLSKARQVLGAGPVLLSGPHGPSLEVMDADQVYTICRSILNERDEEKDPHFILVSLGADVPYNTPPENLHAMREALAKVGWNAG
ncbi:uroporphyrinogen decarboxylase family protein [Desulforhopalus sp. 52FAK]